jgi:hypothetical protein
MIKQLNHTIFILCHSNLSGLASEALPSEASGTALPIDNVLVSLQMTSHVSLLQ